MKDTHHIELVNFELGYTSPPRKVQGYSTKSYGQSRFDRKYNAHSITLTVAEYNAAAKDLAKAWHHAGRKWVPFFVENQAVDSDESPADALRGTAFFALRAKAKALGINPEDHKGDREGLIAKILEAQAEA